MKRTLLLALLLWHPVVGKESTSGPEPVLRVESIKPADGKGPAVLSQQRPGDANGYPVSVNTTGYLKDHFLTDKNTLAALEFLIGGRVGINKDTDVEVVSERSVADGKVNAQRIILKNGSLWVKADANQLKQPLEIQTSGGVMAIKGTEFTVDEEEDGTVQICCFESNSELGGVEIRDAQGQLVGLARPGDEYRVHRLRKPVVRRFQDVAAFRQDVLSRRFREMHRDDYFMKRFMGGLGFYPPPEQGRAYHFALKHSKIERHAHARWSKMGRQRRAQFMRNLNFPCRLIPDASDPQQRPVGPHPVFSWQGVPRADGYVVTVSRDEGGDDVVFTERVKTTNTRYPVAMRPLDPGQYFWRIIPVDTEDQPVLEASQTNFLVKSPG